MKKYISLILAIIMVLTLSACSKKPEAIPLSPEELAPKEETIREKGDELSELYIAGELVFKDGTVYSDKLPEGVTYENDVLTLNNAVIDAGENPAIYAIGSVNIEFFGDENILAGKYAIQAENSHVDIAGEGKIRMIGSDFAAIYINYGKINFKTGNYYIQGGNPTDNTIPSYGIYAIGYVHFEYGTFDIASNTSAVSAEMFNDDYDLISMGGYLNIKTGGFLTNTEYIKDGDTLSTFMCCISDTDFTVDENFVPQNVYPSTYIS